MGQIITEPRTSAPAASASARPRIDVEGERFETAARLVVAPNAGVFEPSQCFETGSAIRAGQIVGHLTSGVDRTPVISQFAGQTGATLAWAGERVVSHQPVMWLSLDSGTP